MAEVARGDRAEGDQTPRGRPSGAGFRIRPVEIEFWADGAFRLHDRFRWTRDGVGQEMMPNGWSGDTPESLIQPLIRSPIRGAHGRPLSGLLHRHIREP